jgi:hypothetical protein
MFHLVFCVSSLLFGNALLFCIRRTQWRLMMHLSVGWLLGSMITGHVLWVTSYFFRVTLGHAGLAIIAHISASVMLIFLERQRLGAKEFKKKLLMELEPLPSLYLTLMIGCSCVWWFQKDATFDFPIEFPAVGRRFLENDFGFISSVIEGCNSPRQNFYGFSDPYLAHSMYPFSFVGYVYSSCIMVLGGVFPDALLIFGVFNVFAAIVGIYSLVTSLSSGHEFLVAILYIFGGGFTQGFHWQLIEMHFGFSVTAGFAIPMGIIALALVQSTSQDSLKERCIISGLLIALNPSILTVLGFLVIISCYSHCYQYLLPIAITLLPKGLFRLQVKQVWMEYKMQGYFFAQIICMIEAYGFPFFALFALPIFRAESVYVHRVLSTLTGFLVLCFFRQGNDLFYSDVALSSLFVPFVLLNFVKFFDHFNPKSAYWRGVVAFGKWAVVGITIACGVYRMQLGSSSKASGFDEASYEVGNFIKRAVQPHAVVLSDAKSMNPCVFFTGRQIWMGSSNDLWMRGQDIRRHSRVFDSVVLKGEGVKMMVQNGIDYLMEFAMAALVLRSERESRSFDVVRMNKMWGLFKLKIAERLRFQ